jgi:hypothetical protein
MKMAKKYQFKITVEPVVSSEGRESTSQPLNFQVGNHDDILQIVQRMRQGTHFDENTATAFAVGLKLLTEVVLENKDDPLFAELKPAITAFMPKLKAGIKERLPQQQG